ncbi:MAG: galactose-1-phosphate uridylyltransferase [Candidatus Pacebacteria bacterium]|nr:galactose-1-phosphate uridylyltransferase [Candidatus Paceibacterota bacterium]MDD4073948.1 galactose-1-phosphate uridylyltransferase [Candidatus Paceibacterota bacterium]
MKKENTEVRYDIVSNEWIIISPKRGARPNNFQEARDCPFCDLKDQEKPKFYFYKGKESNGKKWTTVVIPNKYPVFNLENKNKKIKDGVYSKIIGKGHHDLIITKEHDKFLSQLEDTRSEEVFTCIQKLINSYKDNNFVKQVAIFHNKGEKSGASQPHPHYQVMTLPIIEREFKTELESFNKFYKKNKKCLYCEINKRELKEKERIVLENEHFIAFCPFAPKVGFQVVISPKRHNPNFEKITEEEKKSLSKIFKKMLYKYDNILKEKNYNFFIHTAPLNKEYPYFHWYMVFYPRSSSLGGLEMGFRIEISQAMPEEQAKILREGK